MCLCIEDIEITSTDPSGSTQLSDAHCKRHLKLFYILRIFPRIFVCLIDIMQELFSFLDIDHLDSSGPDLQDFSLHKN